MPSRNQTIMLVLAALAAALILYLLFASPEPPPEPPAVEEAPALPAVVLEPEPLPEPEPEPPPAVVPEPTAAPEPEPFAFPELVDSDAFVREQALSVANDEALATVLGADQLVRRYAAVLESAAKGELVREPIAYLSLPGTFAVDRREDRMFIAPTNYERYDAAAALVESIDPEKAASLLEVLQPLFASAYEELGEPPADVRSRVLQAIDQVLATPVVDGPVELERISVMYSFKDPRLEALAPTQKLLLRMGPDNGARVRAALQRLRAGLAP